MSLRTSLTLAALVVAASPLAAQGRGRAGDKVPPGHIPPAGMCRIWIDGVPPGRQPAPTDCATARRRVPENARVVYGPRSSRRDDYRYDDRYDVVRDRRDVRRDDDDRKVATDRKDDDRYEDDRKIEDRKVSRDDSDRDTRVNDRDGDPKVEDRKVAARKR